jgi:hypothetical protein
MPNYHSLCLQDILSISVYKAVLVILDFLVPDLKEFHQCSDEYDEIQKALEIEEALQEIKDSDTDEKLDDETEPVDVKRSIKRTNPY